MTGEDLKVLDFVTDHVVIHESCVTFVLRSGHLCFQGESSLRMSEKKIVTYLLVWISMTPYRVDRESGKR